MAVLQYQDSQAEIVITSAFFFNTRSQAFRAFTEALYLLHESMPLGEYDVDTVDAATYNVLIQTSGGRTFEQRIEKTDQWRVRQQSLSSYFTLAELLLNNAVRTAVQDLIDAFSVSDIQVEFV